MTSLCRSPQALGVEEKEKLAEAVSTFKAVNAVGVGNRVKTVELLVTEMLVKATASLRAKSSISAAPESAPVVAVS